MRWSTALATLLSSLVAFSAAQSAPVSFANVVTALPFDTSASQSASVSSTPTIPLLLPSTSSSTAPRSVYVEKTSYGGQLRVEGRTEPALALAGGLLIVVSLATLGLGATTVWSSAGSAGFLLGSLFSWALICILRLLAIDEPPSRKTSFLLVLAGFVSGAIGATAATASRHLIALVGATGGIAIGFSIQSMGDDGLIRSVPARIGFLVGLSVISTVASTEHRHRNIARIVMSSASGALSLMLGVDLFWRQGLRETFLFQIGLDDLFPGLDGSLPTSSGVQLAVAIGCSIFLLAVGYQHRVLYRQPGSNQQLAKADEDEELERDIHDLTAGFRDASALQEWEETHGKRKTSSNMLSTSSAVLAYTRQEPIEEVEGEEERTPPPPFEEDEPTLESRFGAEPSSVLDMLGEGAEETAAAMGDFYVQPLRRSYAVDPEVAAAAELRAQVAALRAELDVVDPAPPPEPAPDFLGVGEMGRASRRNSSWSLPSRYMAPASTQQDTTIFTDAPWLRDNYHKTPSRPPLAILPPPVLAGSTILKGPQAAASELSAWSRPPQSAVQPASILSAWSRTGSSVRFAPTSLPIISPRPSPASRRSMAPEELAARHKRKLAELQGKTLIVAGPPAPPTTVGRAERSRTASTSTTTTSSGSSEGPKRVPKRVVERRARDTMASEMSYTPGRRKNGEEAATTRHSHWLDYA